MAAARLISTPLHETDVYDLATFVSVPVVLAVVALIACYAPAHRPAHVDPVDALRAE